MDRHVGAMVLDGHHIHLLPGHHQPVLVISRPLSIDGSGLPDELLHIRHPEGSQEMLDRLRPRDLRQADEELEQGQGILPL